MCAAAFSNRHCVCSYMLLLQPQSASPMQLQLNNDQTRRKDARDEAHISLQSINPILCSVYIGEFPSPSRRPIPLKYITYLPSYQTHIHKSTCTQSFPPHSDGFCAGALLSTLRTRELIPKNPIPNRCWCIACSSPPDSNRY